MGCEVGEELALIVVNYGSSALLASLLAPLSASLPGSTTVVVDNWSTADERRRVAALADERGWILVAPESNLGFGAGINLGAAAALERGATFLLLLNPDASITPEAVCALVERARAEPAALYSPRISRSDGSTWFAGADLHLDDGRLRNRSARVAGRRIEPWLSGACLLVHSSLWQEVGGFDEDYFLYWEDVDLSHRVLAAGGALVVCDDIPAIHDEGGTHASAVRQGDRRKSDTYYYYVIRNRALFAAKHLEPGDNVAWARLERAVAWEVLLQGGRRQFLRSLGPLVVARRAIRDGRMLASAALSRRFPE